MFDSWLPDSKDHLPLTWWKQRPVYLSTILALVAVGSIVLYAILGVELSVGWLAFRVDALKEWKLWTPVTYLLVNAPSIWVLIGCLMLWRFGEEVERHLGRRSFVHLLLWLTFSAPAATCLLYFAGVNGAIGGVKALEFAVFVAFATLYPRAILNLFIVQLEAWLLALILIVVDMLQLAAYRLWFGLIPLVVNASTAYLFILYCKGELQLPSLAFLKRSNRPSRTAARPARRQAYTSGGNAPAPTRGKAQSSTPSVDDILDKISHKGMHSLTAEERRILDQASDEMKRRS